MRSLALALITSQPYTTLERTAQTTALLAYCLMDNGSASQQPEAPALQNLPQPLSLLKWRAADNPWGSDTTYYVLGTAHVSTASCQDVVALIRAVRPEVVLVELCRERKPLLTLEKVKVRCQQGRGGILCFAGRRAHLLLDTAAVQLWRGPVCKAADACSWVLKLRRLRLLA